MVSALRYLGYYWLAMSALVVVLYNWLLLHRLPKGTETIEVVLFVPGLLFLATSFVISYRRRRREADAVRQVFPSGVPTIRLNDAANDPAESRPTGEADERALKTGAPLIHAGEMAEAKSHRDSASAPSPTPRGNAPATNLAMEQARDLLVSSVMKNAGSLQEAVLLLAKEDVTVADGLSRVLQASETLARLTPHDRA